MLVRCPNPNATTLAADRAECNRNSLFRYILPPSACGSRFCPESRTRAPCNYLKNKDFGAQEIKKMMRVDVPWNAGRLLGLRILGLRMRI